LRLALIPTVGPYLLPHVAARLRKELPRLKLMLYEYQTGPLLERLRAGDLDVGILALPVDLEGLESTGLYDEPFTLAVPSTHPLADAERVRIDDLRGETLLLLEDGHCLRDQALEVCGRVRVNEAQDYRATSLETLRQMVAAGHGITLLPELAADAPVGTARGLKVKPFARPTPTRTIGAVWRKSSTRGPVIEAVATTIRSVMKEHARK
jgi:LysR family hydrogen peroxide-inducible transcriptional activator